MIDDNLIPKIIFITMICSVIFTILGYVTKGYTKEQSIDILLDVPSTIIISIIFAVLLKILYL